jgi:hypothetical protein
VQVILMSDQCECKSGRCIPPYAGNVDRRQFLRTVGVGALGASLVGGPLAFAAELMPPSSPRLGKLRRFEMTPPRVYSGEHLSAVAMPIGGIGAGSVWLDGRGKLSIWQVFNNLNETGIPGSFLAVRAQPDGAEPVTRVLQTVGEKGFEPVQSLTFEGGYPIARLRFQDDALPVELQLEACNPMIPTDAANSALPCAILRVTARNTQPKPVTVSLLGTLQNAVGSQGRGGIDGVRFADYGANENRLVRERGMAAASLTRSMDPPPPGLVRAKGNDGFAETPRMLWLPELGGLTETAQSGPTATAAVGLMADMAANGGTIVVGNARPEFFQAILDVRKEMAGWDQLHIFEDFEDGTYDGWTVKGEAFGKAPHTGTSPGQQEVSGFMGKRLVNSFVPHDGPQGELISKPFKVERKYIGFLIGGGNHPNETCMNLVVDGKTVRTATGKNNERLEPMSWDVSDFVGQTATLQIIDHSSGGWGHVNIDHIVFADAPPDDLLALRGPIQMIAQELDIKFDGVELERLNEPAPAQRAFHLEGVTWEVTERVALRGADVEEDVAGWPFLLTAKLGKAKFLASLAPDMPWTIARFLFWLAAFNPSLDIGDRDSGEPDPEFVTTDAGYGSMALATTTGNATCDLAWTDGEALAKAFAEAGKLSGPEQAGPTEKGETANSALCATFRLQPGVERTTTFVIAWHFPNADRFGHWGNQYARRFGDALGVARYVCENLDTLWERTELYHQTVYESNLPEEFIDAMTSQSVIFRGPTVWWDERDYFAGFEGSYGCCPLNCTHVWNYAQSLARLFPEIDRNMRHSDLTTRSSTGTAPRSRRPCARIR